MIIYLNRRKIPEISKLLQELNPPKISEIYDQKFRQNWPKPKGGEFIPDGIIEQVFEIADFYLSDNEITGLLTQWVHQETFSFFSNVLEKSNAPLIEVAEALKKFARMFKNRNALSLNERIGLRVSLIIRFLSENLSYINISKHHLTIEAMVKIIDRVVGPAYGNGKLGGKSAGMILARQILLDKKNTNSLLQNVRTPKSRFLTSDGLLEFMHYNALEELVFTKYLSPEEIKEEYSFVEYIFKNSHFPPESINAFYKIIDDFEGRPIVVRSSSLLEDSFEASFSGKYKSLFLANVGTKEERFSALINAIVEVYASTFAPDPIEYRKERGLLDFREEMGILIQEVVGIRAGKYYMPAYAGVAFSNNEFRWSPRINREDGVIRLVAGLGTRAVDRTMNDYPTLITPGQPGLKANASYHEKVCYSQTYIDVINLETNSFETKLFSDLVKEVKGNFPSIDKIVSFNRNGMLVDPVGILADFVNEDIIITFNKLIEKTNFVKQIGEMLKELRNEFKCPVDIEFASDGEILYLLQCRPQSQYASENKIKIPKNITEEKIIFTANQYISNGVINNVEYMVYVDAEAYSQLETREQMIDIGRIVSLLNRALPKKHFILIGPGRWGSKGDIKLGVPVIYSDINNTAMLIEVARESGGYVPELSFGTHFFQDLVEANIKYLPLYPDKPGNTFMENYFVSSNSCLTDFITVQAMYDKVIRLVRISDLFPDCRLSIFMDGELNKAVAVATENIN